MDGGDDLERHLESACKRILGGIRGLIPAHRLQAVLLGGGYGRGEGGVLREMSGEFPYNDLDLYICLKGCRRLNEYRYRESIDVLGEILSSGVGVEVEIKIASLAEFGRCAVSMFSYDLIARHRWLLGSEEMLAGCGRHRDAANIPMGEATRLLMNRCSGLLFARERLDRDEFTEQDADFVQRNIAKAQLAFGDAVLTANGQYHWSCLERHSRLEELARTDSSPWLATVCAHHGKGVEFKLQPERSRASRPALRESLAEVNGVALRSWLQIEERRLGVPFESAWAYVENPASKCPAADGGRNLLVNLRAIGLRPYIDLKPWRHPRQRIFNALALLLWEPGALTSPLLLNRLRSELSTSASGFRSLLSAYRDLWVQVN